MSEEREIEVGAYVEHNYWGWLGRVLAIAEGHAMVRWQGWHKPDLCELTELRRVYPT